MEKNIWFFYNVREHVIKMFNECTRIGFEALYQANKG